ncbi:MAG: nucleotidyltransferase [Candidatus Roseilinea sp.]|nr:MAG: nucleotidyltransferase [Candidatus Roseilinea sp.]
MPQREVIGLVPMAGRATRLSPLPCSKELFPITMPASDGSARPRVVSHFLLERMRLAGVRKAFLVIREGKWDIPAYYRDGSEMLDLSLAYLVARLPYGPPFSLDTAYPFVQDATVVIGFPDILFQPDDAFSHLIARQEATQADLVLGLFPLPEHLVDDMTELDESGRVRRYYIKQRVPHLSHSWMIATWAPSFTQFMHEYLREYLRANGAPSQEFGMAHVMHAAVEAGLLVQTVTFHDGRFLDIGTPQGLMQLPAFLATGNSQLRPT